MAGREEYHIINDEIKIDFQIPRPLQELLDDAEKADKENSPEYSCIADAIDVLCKNYYSCGMLTQKQWDTVCDRYPV